MKYVAAGVMRAVVFGLLWVSFAGWDPNYAAYGVVSVAAASAMSLGLLPPRGVPNPSRWPRRIWFSARLAVWFLYQSGVGGVDVARRAITRTPDIAPTVVVAEVFLPEGHGRQLAMLMMNLMPGSMIQRGPFTAGPTGERAGEGAGADSRGDAEEVVEIHTLSESLNPAEQWRQLQLRAAPAFS